MLSVKIVTVITQRDDGCLIVNQHSETDSPGETPISEPFGKLIQCLTLGQRAAFEVFQEKQNGVMIVWDEPGGDVGRRDQ